jgi:hypothetical protein
MAAELSQEVASPARLADSQRRIGKGTTSDAVSKHQGDISPSPASDGVVQSGPRTLSMGESLVVDYVSGLGSELNDDCLNFDPIGWNWPLMIIVFVGVALGARFAQGAGNYLVGVEKNPGPGKGKEKVSRSHKKQGLVARKVKQELERKQGYDDADRTKAASTKVLLSAFTELKSLGVPVSDLQVVPTSTIVVEKDPILDSRKNQIEAIRLKTAERLEMVDFLDHQDSEYDGEIDIEALSSFLNDKLSQGYDADTDDGSFVYSAFPGITLTCAENPWFTRGGIPKTYPCLPHADFDEGEEGDGVRRRYIGPAVNAIVPTVAEQEIEIASELRYLQTRKQYEEFRSLNTPPEAEKLIPWLSHLPVVPGGRDIKGSLVDLVKPCLNMGRVSTARLPRYIKLAELPKSNWHAVIPWSTIHPGTMRSLLHDFGFTDRLEMVDQVLLVGIPVFLRKREDVRPWRDKADKCRDDVLVCIQPMILVLYNDQTGRFHTVDAKFGSMTPASMNWFGDTFQFSVPCKMKIDGERFFKRFATEVYTGRTAHFTDRHLLYTPLWVSLYQLVELFSRKTLLAPRLLVSTSMERMMRFAAEDTLTSTDLGMRLAADVNVSRDTLSLLSCLVMGDAHTRLEDF